MKDKVLLISVNKVKKDSYLDDNVQDDKIRIAIEFMQDAIIERVIGTALYDTLCDFILSGDEEENNEDECSCKLTELLDSYIAPIFLYGVQAELTLPLSFKERNIGVFQAGDDKVQPSSMSDINKMANHYTAKMDFYITRCIKFLKCNMDCFPELKGCGCSWCQESFNTKQPSIGLNLELTPGSHLRNRRIY